METRPFGKTGASLPILSLGGQRIVDDEGCTEEQAVGILNTAIDRGIRYFDTAWVYSDGPDRAARGPGGQETAATRCGSPPRRWDTTRDGARRAARGEPDAPADRPRRRVAPAQRL